ncbi:hypothetical protein GWK36_06540 [Caldichromatium japonicum]|uniref:Uncharacterized protein n=1 Tax=Caldichromatium japonicum TaxID=2699430 RepID=A0A6G7VC88_9GAMM|nr:hypothetical protein [Caldichromatium japonicum]QIK37693.1 hypothetical protein GWK36_06540 [Caldichromatium japonicum]
MPKGEVASLNRLLDGPLSETIARRIAQVSLAEIKAWFNRALDALDLVSIFDGEG